MGGIWGSTEIRSYGGAAPPVPRPIAPRAAGRGCCLFKSLQAAGSRWPGRPGPLVLCVALHKRGGQLGRGQRQQVGGWGLAPPPLNSLPLPLGGGCSLGISLLSGRLGPHSCPQTPQIPLPCPCPTSWVEASLHQGLGTTPPPPTPRNKPPLLVPSLHSRIFLGP